MRGLGPYAWRGLAARPVRSLLTIAGIAVGVAVLVAALATTAGLDASVDRTVASLVGRADLRVEAFAERGLSDATLARLDDLPGVALTAPAIERRSFLASAPGRPLVTEPVTVLGIDPASEPRVRDLDLAAGEALDATEPAGEAGMPPALVTERLAEAEGLGLGSEVAILGAGAPLRVTVTGILVGGGPELGSGGRTVVLPIDAARRLLVADAEDGGAGEAGDGKGSDGAGAGVGPASPPAAGGLTRIDLVLAAGADAESTIGSIEAALVTEPYVLTRPQDVAASMRASTADVRATLALLAAVTLFAAAFLVLNATSMTVVERIRELGLLRAAGATRGQLVRLVELQALLLGASGAVGGVVLGAVLAVLVTGWLGAAGTPLDGPSLTPPVIAAGLAAGVLVTLVAALEPARRAASVSPVTALRARSDPAAAARAHVGWLLVVTGAVGGLGVLLLPAGPEAGRDATRAVAVYGLLLAGVLATPVLLGPLGRLAGLPFAAAFRLEERLARAAIARDRGRTTITVGSLVVGLAMVVALASVGANARQAATAWLADVVPGDEILTAITPAPVGADGVDAQLAALPGVARATSLASFDLSFDGTRLEATAVRGADLLADGRLTFVAGDRATALAAIDAGGSVILPAARADRLGLAPGDELVVAGVAGPVTLRVAGVVERSFPGRSGETVLVGWQDALDAFGVAGADAIALRLVPGSASAAARVAELAGELALTVAPVSRVEGAIGDALERVFGLLDVLALAAVVVAGLGIVNTLSMDAWERTRELGMLRAAGMSRRQAWRGVVVEAGILGLIGSVVGTGTGIAVGLVLVTTSGGRMEAGIALPWPAIALALAAGVGLAMLAAAQPARVVARHPIVAAVRLEA